LTACTCKDNDRKDHSIIIITTTTKYNLELVNPDFPSVLLLIWNYVINTVLSTRSWLKCQFI